MDSFEISCTQTGPATTIELDYVNILNGEFLWQPARDQEISYLDADWPLGGNVASVVRTDVSGAYLVAASNNGGVALSTDGSGDVWWLINGEVDGKKLDSQDKLRTWDVFAEDDSDIVVLNGNVTGVAYDVDESSTPYDVTSIWISTAGNGVWEGSRGWRY